MTGEDVFKDLKEPFAQDIAGVAAQGNSPNPPSRFSNHWIINAAALFYDPSYGIGPVDNTYKYERAAFEGRIQREILYNLPKNGVINSYLLTSSLE